jgi:hypothetical protein
MITGKLNRPVAHLEVMRSRFVSSSNVGGVASPSGRLGFWEGRRTPLGIQFLLQPLDLGLMVRNGRYCIGAHRLLTPDRDVRLLAFWILKGVISWRQRR